MPNSRNEYDAIVIGSGIGGLTTGCYLAKRGVRVLVCEQNHQPGGCFTSFKHKGYTFDGGIQGCENAGMLLPMLEHLGIRDKIHLTQGKSAVATPDGFIPFATYHGLTGFYQHLARQFPDHAQGIMAVSDVVQRLCRLLEAVFAAPNPLFTPSLGAFIKGIGAWVPRHLTALKHGPLFLEVLKYPIADYLRTMFGHDGLARSLTQCIYRGSSAAYALPFFYFFTEYCYPRGGVQAIPDLLADYINTHGGEVRCNTLVQEVLLDGCRARGVRLADGREIRAHFVISNGDARRLYQQMLPADAIPEAMQRRLRYSEVSESFVSVFLGADIDPKDLPVQGCQHVLYFTSYDGVRYEDIVTDPGYFDRPYIMMMIPSLEDPTLAPSGKSVIILQAASVQERDGSWGIPDGKRTKAYRELKEKTALRLIAHAEKIIPGLAGKIEVMLTATPHTYARYTLNSGGASGGWTKNINRTFRRGFMGLMNIATPVKNLYMVGHWTSIPGGAPIGMMSGKLVADLVCLRLKLRRWTGRSA